MRDSHDALSAHARCALHASVGRTRFTPGFAGHIDREAKILSGSRNVLVMRCTWDRRRGAALPTSKRRRGKQTSSGKHATASIDALHYLHHAPVSMLTADARLRSRTCNPACPVGVTKSPIQCALKKSFPAPKNIHEGWQRGDPRRCGYPDRPFEERRRAALNPTTTRKDNVMAV
ncbi:MAG TPA: hypothetical protein VJQ42_01480, partial [Rhodanobacteraceae bacterium]|nr:hypothetical protein [Rhodanobacteraceae bacterium]